MNCINRFCSCTAGMFLLLAKGIAAGGADGISDPAQVPQAPEAGTRILSVLDFGAKGDGVADDTEAIQRALDAAKGVDGVRTEKGLLPCGEGRTVFRLYFPNCRNGFYKITRSLKIDGTIGLVIYGDGGFTKRAGVDGSSRSTAVIRWYGKASLPVFWVKGGCGRLSNPNRSITFRDLTISGAPTLVRRGGKLPENMALSGIHFGPLENEDPEATLVRSALIENVEITNCRFGIYSGNVYDKNTDHATVNIIASQCWDNAQAGILWGTGNAIVNVIGCHLGQNGEHAEYFSKDKYSPAVGANIHVTGGYMDIVSYTSSGQPVHADIYQSAGRIAVTNAWSDTAGYFLYQKYVSQNKGGYHNTQLTGIRHYNADRHFENNTPHSLRLIAPGMVVSGCLFYGNVVVDSGFGGRPVFSGINFIRKDAGFIGTGVEKQRSLVVLGNTANHGQIFLGGVEKGVKARSLGNPVPGIILRGGNPAVFQALGAGNNSSGVTFYVNTDNGNAQSSLLINAYLLNGRIVPLQADKMVWRIGFGGRNGFSVSGYDPGGSTEAFDGGKLIPFGGWLCPPLKGYGNEVVFMPPQRSVAPSFNSGDFWRGGMYFDTKENKLKVNIGKQNWVPLH